MATKYDFAVGDVVYLKHNKSPYMTINALYRDQAQVCWFDNDDKLHHAFFAYDTIVKRNS